MISTKHLFVAALAAFAFDAEVRAQSLSDFGVPAAAETPAEKSAQRKVEAPDEVKRTGNDALGEEVISAKTDADAIKAGNQDLIESDGGVRFVATGSGVGILAGASADYDTRSKNPNLVLLSQRQAFVRALLKAKTEMSKTLKGSSIEGKTFFSEQMDRLETEDGSMANADASSAESTSEAISTMLKGVIVYDVIDDPDAGFVMVTVLTTPQTQGAMQTSAGNQMTAESLETGLGEVFKQIRTGTIPPEGGYTVVAPSNGQIAWVGFGSAIAGKNADKRMTRKFLSAAKATSKLRARKALLSCIKGEEIQAEISESQEMTESIKQFDRTIDEDGNAAEVAKQQTEYAASAALAFKESGGSTTSGKLPPGVSMKTYVTKDGNWAYSVAVYMAAMTEAAKAAAQQMASNSPVKAGSVGSFQVEPDGSFKLKDGKLIPKSMGSGRIGRGLKGF